MPTVVRCVNPHCRAKVNVPEGRKVAGAVCPQCREPLVDNVALVAVEKTVEKIKAEKDSAKRYWALKQTVRFNTAASSGLALVFFVLAIVSIYLFVTTGNADALYLFGISILFLVLFLVFGVAWSDLIRVILDIESHLRKLADRD